MHSMQKLIWVSFFFCLLFRSFVIVITTTIWQKKIMCIIINWSLNVNDLQFNAGFLVFFYFYFFKVLDTIVRVHCNFILKQVLPFHSTIVQREFTHIAYALLFSCRLDCNKHICQRILYFLYLHSKNFLC